MNDGSTTKATGTWKKVLDQGIQNQINDNAALISDCEALVSDLNSIIEALSESSGNMNACYNYMLEGLFIEDIDYMLNLEKIKKYGADFSTFSGELTAEVQNIKKQIYDLEELNLSLESQKYKWVFVENSTQ